MKNFRTARLFGDVPFKHGEESRGILLGYSQRLGNGISSVDYSLPENGEKPCHLHLPTVGFWNGQTGKVEYLQGTGATLDAALLSIRETLYREGSDKRRVLVVGSGRHARFYNVNGPMEWLDFELTTRPSLTPEKESMPSASGGEHQGLHRPSDRRHGRHHLNRNYLLSKAANG